MSLFPHPPPSSSKRTGRGGMGNIQNRSAVQELDLGPEKYLLPKDHFSLLNRNSTNPRTVGQPALQATESSPLKQSPEACWYTPTPSSSESGSSPRKLHLEKGPEVRTWEKWSRSIQQGKSKDLSTEVGTADRWRSKLLKSLTAEVNNMRKKGPVEVGLAEEWRAKILKSLVGPEDSHS